MARVALFAFALTFASIVSAPPVPAADVYEINAIVPQTGSSALLGRAYLTSFNVIENLVNKSGGIGGRPIKFVIADDQSNAQVAVQLINGLIAKNAPVVIGPASVGNCLAAMPLIKNGPVMYCTSPGIHPPAGSFAFSAGVSTLSSLQVLAHYFHLRGWSKVGIITSTDATGQEAERNIDEAFADEKAGTIVDREHFNFSDISVAAQMTHLAASGADVIIAWAVGTPFSTLMRGASDAGISVPIATANGNLIYSQLEDLHGYLPKNFYFPGIPSAATVEQLPKGPLRSAESAYIEAFQAAGIKPEVGQYQTWDVIWIVVNALRKLGPTATAAQLRDEIANLRGWVGVHGPYDFHAFPERGIGNSSIVVARWDATKNTWVTVSSPGGGPP